MTDSPAAGLTRRELLRAMATTGVLAVGGGLLSSCSSIGGSGVVLTSNEGYAFGPMPTKEQQKADTGSKAYAESLHTWMKKNPGVTIKNVTLNSWDQQTLMTSVAGGTAPSVYPADVLGGWNRATVKSAMAQGLAADVTEFLKKYRVDEKIEEFAKPIWDGWKIDGKHYAAPGSYNVGTGIHYRIDLIRKLGLPEPHPDWTWDDVRKLAKGLTNSKRKGLILQAWGVNMGIEADGMGFHADIPAPNTRWNWKSDYVTRADQWVPLIQRMRDMIFTDDSVLADVSMGDGDTLAAFCRGDAAMHNNTVVYYTIAPGGGNAPADLAKQLDKPIEEICGWMTQPNGRDGRTANTQGQVDSIGFSPDLDHDSLDKAVSLTLYMEQDGWVHQRTALYEATKDPKRVYDSANIMPIYKGLLHRVPSSPDEAWGKPFMDQVRRAARIPLYPNDSWYFPPQTNPAPTSTARDDMTSRWANERGRLDLRADLQKLTDTVNKQSGSFTSSTSDQEFIASARRYFAAHADYWQQNAPDYYENVFKDWYDKQIRPVLG